MAHIRHSRLVYGLGFHVKASNPFEVSSLPSELEPVNFDPNSSGAQGADQRGSYPGLRDLARTLTRTPLVSWALMALIIICAAPEGFGLTSVLDGAGLSP